MKKIFLLLFGISLINSCSSGSEEPPPPPIKYTLTTVANPSEGGAINPNGGIVNEGTQISITATPSAEYLFDKWTGAASGNSPSISVIMDSNKSVTANFIKKKYALTTSVEGEGTVSEKVIKAGAATDYNSGTIVELTATPSDGWEFKEWTGDLESTENPTQITIDKAKTVKAVFNEQSPFYLDENGVTIKARDGVTAGTAGELNGVTYTAVNLAMLQKLRDEGEDLSKVVTTLVKDMSSLFATTSLNNYDDFNDDISSWDVSNVTSMYALFAFNFGKFNQDISEWDVGNVTNMTYMFLGCNDFNQNIGGWDVSNVTKMTGMFIEAFKFNQNISEWDVSNVEYMDTMFQNADSFNQSIVSWDVSNVKTMTSMFSEIDCVTTLGESIPNCTGFDQNIGDWDVSNVRDMRYMFKKNIFFNKDIGDWNVSNVEIMNYMFSGTPFNQDIGDWDVSNVTQMGWMFNNAQEFNQDLTKWCVTNITSEPNDFSVSSALTQVNKPLWGTCPGNSYTIAVTASSSADYTLSGEDRNGDVSGNDPGLNFKVGDEVTFSVNAANHPFYLKTAAGTGTGNQISGVTNQGTTNGSVVWTPSEAGTYYYQCSAHSGMVGTITIE